ncbi:MAG TPA: ATP-binding protein [Gemmatimonadaceae bacterium]|nr:ATP-binding protein [Gemmatimonadaceae bacterium]
MPDAPGLAAVPRQRRSITLRAGAAALFGGGVAYLFNSVPIPIADGASITLGGMVTLFVALRFGARWGALAAALGFLPTVFYWGHPIAWMLAIGETIVVGRRTQPDALPVQQRHARFWLVAAPLLLFTYYLFSPRALPAAAALIIVLKHIGNAVVMLALARVALGIPHLLGRPRAGAGKVSLRDYLVGAAAAAVAVPAILAALGLARVFESQVMREEAETTRALATSVATLVTQAIVERQSTLASVARYLGGGDAVNRDVAQSLLESVGSTSRSYLTMLVADADGAMIAGYSTRPEVTRSLLRDGFTVEQRPYFRVPRRTGQPYVSDPFIGRGFGADHIVAISVPIVGRDGRFLGIVEGSISTSELRSVVGNVPDGYRVQVVSQARRIVAWSDDDAPPLKSVEEILPPLLVSEPFRTPDGPMDRVLHERRAEPGVSIAQQSRLVALAPAASQWFVSVSRTYSDAQGSLRRLVQLATLGALAAFLFLRLLFHRVLRDVLQPLDELADAVGPDRLRVGPPEPVVPRIGATAPREILALAIGFDAMQAALDTRFEELRTALRERDDVNRQMEQTLGALDELVLVRTRDLERALEEARHAAMAKTEFLASMSHELRTPLNAVIGSADALRDGVLGPLSDAQRAALDQVDQSAEHLLALIGDILDMERIASGRLVVRRERVDLRALVDRVRASIQPLADDAGLRFTVLLPMGGLYIDGDPLRLQQVLLNLLGNAVKFTPAGGAVTLRVRTGAVPGRCTAIEVEDSGIGIPEEQRQRIFEPFVQAEGGDTRRFGGTGLGLSISRALCEAMGLRLVILRSSPNGTVFSVAV